MVPPEVWAGAVLVYLCPVLLSGALAYQILKMLIGPFMWRRCGAGPCNSIGCSAFFNLDILLSAGLDSKSAEKIDAADSNGAFF